VSLLEPILTAHKRECGRFYIRGKVTSQYVYGVCSKCGNVLEMYKKAIYAVKVHKVE
jgi:hypothetical protein